MLLLAAWHPYAEGGGPDAWVMTGHALRLLRRLGVHKVLDQLEMEGAAGSRSRSGGGGGGDGDGDDDGDGDNVDRVMNEGQEQGSGERLEKMQKALPQCRTWLAWVW